MKCNSYMIVNIEIGIAVFEFYNPALIERVNAAKYRVMTAHDYLCEFNKRIKSESV